MYQNRNSQDIYPAANKRLAPSGGIRTASKITSVLEILSDGRWCTREEIREKVQIGEAQLQRIIDFLKEYNFIVVRNDTGKSVKLNKLAQEFLDQSPTA